MTSVCQCVSVPPHRWKFLRLYIILSRSSSTHMSWGMDWRLVGRHGMHSLGQLALHLGHLGHQEWMQGWMMFGSGPPVPPLLVILSGPGVSQTLIDTTVSCIYYKGLNCDCAGSDTNEYPICQIRWFEIHSNMQWSEMKYMCNKHLFLFNLDNFTPDTLFYTDVVHGVRDKYQVW